MIVENFVPKTTKYNFRRFFISNNNNNNNNDNGFV